MAGSKPPSSPGDKSLRSFDFDAIPNIDPAQFVEVCDELDGVLDFGDGTAKAPGCGGIVTGSSAGPCLGELAAQSEPGGRFRGR
jgi:hypothetical protein